MAEVTGRRREAPAEVLLPNTIDDHPRSERVFLAGDPAGQGSAAARAGQRGRRWLDHGRVGRMAKPQILDLFLLKLGEKH